MLSKAGQVCGGKNTITYEIHHNVPDKWGNHYPPKEKCYITVSKTANSSGELTLEYLDNVFLPAVGADAVPKLTHPSQVKLKKPAGLVLDAFRGHFDQKVKVVTEPNELLDWLLMDGGITPKGQPLDVLLNKVFKGHFRDLFDSWPLNAPVNEKTGHPMAPSRQLLAKWIVEAWEKVSEELVRKAWTVSGYKTMEELKDATRSKALVKYTRRELCSIVEKIAGEDASQAMIDPYNEPWPNALCITHLIMFWGLRGQNNPQAS